MTLTIALTPEQEARLRAIADRVGLDAMEYVQQLIAQSDPDRENPEHLNT